MKKIMTFLLFFAVWIVLWNAPPACAQDLNVGVDIILASESGGGVDSRLSGIENQLQSIFRFSSYALYDQKSLSIAMGGESQVSLPEGRVFLLSPLYFQGNLVVIRARILSAGSLVVDTQFRVSPGGSFFVGGPRTSQGVIILKVTAH